MRPVRRSPERILMSRTVVVATLGAIVVIVGFVLLGIFADASFAGIAAIVAAVAFGAAMLGLMSLFLTLMGAVRELTFTIRQLTDQAVPILSGLTETVSGVNTELGRV